MLFTPDPHPRLALTEHIRAELYGSDMCSALGIMARAYAPVLELCRQLVAAGHNPASRLEAYRLGVLCLRVRSIGEGARLDVNGRGTGLIRYRGVPAAPSVAPIGPKASPPQESSVVVPLGPGPARADDGLDIPDFLRRTPISRPRDQPQENDPTPCTTSGRSSFDRME